MSSDLRLFMKHIYELIDQHYNAGAKHIGVSCDGKTVYFISSILPVSDQMVFDDEFTADDVYQAMRHYIGGLKPRGEIRVGRIN